MAVFASNNSVSAPGEVVVHELSVTVLLSEIAASMTIAVLGETVVIEFAVIVVELVTLSVPGATSNGMDASTPVKATIAPTAPSVWSSRSNT